MTPEQALQILDVAAGNARLNRVEHVQVQEAIVVLQTLLNEKDPTNPNEDSSLDPKTTTKDSEE